MSRWTDLVTAGVAAAAAAPLAVSVGASVLLAGFLVYKRNVQDDKVCAPKESVPHNLNMLLAIVYRHFVALRDEDFRICYDTFCDVFAVLQANMKAVDPYYAQYSSRKQFAGSHADNLRIGRPDEFDLDIVIRMPFCYTEAPNSEESDLVIEPHVPGHVRVRGGRQYAALPTRDNWKVNQTAYKWFDRNGYILRTKFTDWFKSVVVRALNRLPKGKRGFPIVKVKDEIYYLKTRDSGPAYTLLVHRADGFRIDVDLVPTLKFSEDRWPPSRDYRDIPQECSAGDWLLVPKAARGVKATEAPSSWRVSLYTQEYRLKHSNYCLNQAIRFLKKLRDTLEMKEIASYYIKTLLLWEVDDTRHSDFWYQSDGALFKLMVLRLYQALRERRIPFYWNESNNLIGHVHPQLLKTYELKLRKLLDLLEHPQIELDKVAKFLLTPSEYSGYRKLF